MTPAQLERYLHQHIPLSRAMQVSVCQLDAGGVTLAAPLAPNINHRETVFGGSAAAVAVLAAWSLLHFRLFESASGSRLVIQRSSMSYERPITGTFTARSCLANPGRWDAFEQTLARRGKARIAVAAVLEQDAQAAGRFDGDFVALGRDG